MRKRSIIPLAIGSGATLIVGVIVAIVLLSNQEPSDPRPAASERQTKARVTTADTIDEGACCARNGHGGITFRMPTKTLGVEFTGSDGRSHSAVFAKVTGDYQVGDTVRIKYDPMNPAQVKFTDKCGSPFSCGPGLIAVIAFWAVVVALLVGLSILVLIEGS